MDFFIIKFVSEAKGARCLQSCSANYSISFIFFFSTVQEGQNITNSLVIEHNNMKKRYYKKLYEKLGSLENVILNRETCRIRDIVLKLIVLCIHPVSLVYPGIYNF